MEFGLKFIELQRIFPKACLGYPVTLTEAGFVVSKTKKIQRLSKIVSAYFQRLFKDL
jgi:hypothetical protein